MASERTEGIKVFPRALARSGKQTDWTRIKTRFVNSISKDDNSYTKYIMM